MENFKNIQAFEQEDKIISFDPGKFRTVIRRFLPWILLLLLISITISFLVIRYTKPLYESRSILKLDIKSEASILGLNNLDEEKSYNNLLSEIELLKSKLFYNKIIDGVNLNINVFTIGKFLDDERYQNAPFEVKYTVNHPDIYDLRFRVGILNDRQFNLSYNFLGRNFNSNHNFGDPVRTDYFEFLLVKSQFFDPDARDSEFFFRINSRVALLEYIENNFNVEPLKLNTNTIEISFKDYNRQKARDLVNAIDTIYLTYTKEEKMKANSQKIEFLNMQLESTEQRLSDFEEYFEGFIIDNKTTDLQDKLDETIRAMNGIDSNRYQLQLRLSRLEELRSNLDSGIRVNLAVQDFNILPDEMIDQINELNELLNQSESILLSYNKNTQAYRLRTSEIDALYQKIQDFFDEYIQSARSQIKRYNDQKLYLERNFVELPSKNTEFSKSQRYYSLYEEFYLSLMQKKAEFQLAMAGTVTDFKILSPATFPVEPLKPKKYLIYGIGSSLWLVVSFFLIGIGYLSFNRIIGAREVENLTQVPILGLIPQYSYGKGEIAGLIVDPHKQTAIAEAFRSLRTNMQFILPRESGVVISISSTVSGEGKTFVGLNLSAIFAMSGKRVLLVDMDLRKPKLQKVYKPVIENCGMSTLLIQQKDLDECILRTDIKNLDVMLAGPVPPNPSELLMSSEMDHFLKRVRKKYDLILLDTPPIGIVTDGVLAMKKADIQMYILRAEYSKTQFIDFMEKTNAIHQFPHLYLILNSIKSERGIHYGYGYGSGYYTEKKRSFFK
ncbi:MAG: polysaccharide biosynthesis tyrosine autokinase [Cyclobacteriaceae bacterium]|nr:polysaccharide biosynthesis tyrosine autokinase [Cyclobacteriaceae bacterium]